MLSDKKEYKGLISQCFGYHNEPISIERVYSKNKQLSLEGGYLIKKFLYDIKYIDDFIDEFKDEVPENIIDIMKNKKDSLILEIKEKYNSIINQGIFKNCFFIADLYKDILTEIFGDISMFKFSDSYYLKRSRDFTKLDIANKPTSKILPELYLQGLYSIHKKDSMLISLESAMGINEEYLDIDSPKIKGIYIVDFNGKITMSSPDIYSLDISTTLFQLSKMANYSKAISNIYFDFGDKILKSVDSGGFNEWDVVFANPAKSLIKKGTYFMPYLGGDDIYKM